MLASSLLFRESRLLCFQGQKEVGGEIESREEHTAEDVKTEVSKELQALSETIEPLTEEGTNVETVGSGEEVKRWVEEMEAVEGVSVRVEGTVVVIEGGKRVMRVEGGGLRKLQLQGAVRSLVQRARLEKNIGEIEGERGLEGVEFSVVDTTKVKVVYGGVEQVVNLVNVENRWVRQMAVLRVVGRGVRERGEEATITMFQTSFKTMQNTLVDIRKDTDKSKKRIKTALSNIELLLQMGDSILKTTRANEDIHIRVRNQLTTVTRYYILLSLISQNSKADLKALEKDPLLASLTTIIWNEIDWDRIPDITAAQQKSRFFKAQMVAMAARNVQDRSGKVSVPKIILEISAIISKRAKIRKNPIFKERHVRWFADKEKDDVIVGKYIFAREEQIAAIKKQGPASFTLRRAAPEKADSNEHVQTIKNTILNDIRDTKATPSPATFVLSQHGVEYTDGSLAGFSLNSDASKDKKIIIKVEEFAKALQERVKKRDAIPDSKLDSRKDVDYFLMPNCKGSNLQRHIINTLPPEKRNLVMFVTESEFGQLSFSSARIVKRGTRIISKKRHDTLLDSVLQIEKDTPSTFGTLFENEEGENLDSNPSVIHANDKGEFQQLSTIEPRNTYESYS